MANLPFHIRPAAEARAAPGQFGDYRGLDQLGRSIQGAAAPAGRMARRKIDKRERDAERDRLEEARIAARDEQRAYDRKERDAGRLHELNVRSAQNAMEAEFQEHAAIVQQLISDKNFTAASEATKQWEESWPALIEQHFAGVLSTEDEVEARSIKLIQERMKPTISRQVTASRHAIISGQASHVISRTLESGKAELTTAIIQSSSDIDKSLAQMDARFEPDSLLTAELTESEEVPAGNRTNDAIAAGLSEKYFMGYTLIEVSLRDLARRNDETFEETRDKLILHINNNPHMSAKPKSLLMTRLGSITPTVGQAEQPAIDLSDFFD